MGGNCSCAGGPASYNKTVPPGKKPAGSQGGCIDVQKLSFPTRKRGTAAVTKLSAGGLRRDGWLTTVSSPQAQAAGN